MDRPTLLQETICLLSADLYARIYRPENGMGYSATADTIIRYAQEFERKLNWQGEDDKRDFIFELEKFEREVLKELN